MDVLRLCRVCLCEENKRARLLSVFSPCTGLLDVPQLISDLLQVCTQTQVHDNDGFSKNICKKCTSDLRIAYNFKVRCEASYKFMLSLVDENHSVKIEKQCDANITYNVKAEVKHVENKDKANDADLENKKQIKTEEPELSEKEDADEKFNTNFVFDSDFTNAFSIGEIMSQVSTRKHIVRKIVSSTHKRESKKNKKWRTKKTSVTEGSGWECTVCHKTYRYEYMLKLHEKSHYSMKNYYCKMCDKYYTSEKLHKRTHLRTDKFICDICNKTFLTKQKVAQHLEVHDKSREKLFKCDFGNCNKSYLHFHSLLKHKLGHEGKKDFLCHLCSKAFRDKAGLQSHMQYMHYKVRKFKCGLCPKTFIMKKAKNCHEKRHSNIKRHQCDICEKRFFDKHHLSRHMASHLQDMKYSCRFCPKRFVRSDNRRRHEVVSHGIQAACFEGEPT